MSAIFGERIRILRGNSTQAYMAKENEVTQQCWYGWESGTREPSLTTLCSISKRYNVTADWLIGASDSTTGIVDNKDLLKRCVSAEGKLKRVNNALGLVLQGASELQAIVKETEVK